MKEQEFPLPYMVLHRRDIESKEMLGLKRSQELSDEEMQHIAQQLADALMDFWYDSLKAIVQDYKKK